MTRKQLILLFIIALIPYIFFFTTNRFVDPDSYYYLNMVCNGGQSNPGTSDIFSWIVLLFPCNILFIKLIGLLLYFGVLYFASKLGEVFDSKDGWLVGVIVAGLTLFPTEVWKFENDMWGYLFGFAGIYFLAKFHETKQKWITGLDKDLILGLGCFIIGGLLWNGVVYWLVSAVLLTVWATPLLLFSLLFFFNRFFTFMNTDIHVKEEQPIIGFAYYGLASVFLIGMRRVKPWVFVSYLLMLAPVLSQSKFFVLGIPFAALICFEGLKMFWERSKPFYEKSIPILIVLTLCMGLAFGMVSITQFPTDKDINLIKHAIQISPDHIQNDFSAGYIIEYYGGHPQCAGWICDYTIQGTVINIRDTNSVCTVIEKSDFLQLLDC